MAEDDDRGEAAPDELMVSVDYAEKLGNAIGESILFSRLRGVPVPLPVVSGRYEAHQWIGEGGMGGVFRAIDEKLGRQVALKVLSKIRKDAEQELAHEAQCVAKIRDPHVVTVYDFVQCPEYGMALVMELIPGVSARDWARARKRTWQDKLRMWLQAGRGIAAAHAAGVLHGDVKPGNVLVEKGGAVKVVDFGIARILGPAPLSDAAEGVFAGTFVYMAPERIEGRSFTERADQFSYCVVLWELLTGKLPFPGEDEAEVLNAIVTTNLRRRRMPRDVPPTVKEILIRGLSLDPNQRYPSMAELLAELEALLPPKPESPRRRWTLGLVVLVLAVALVMSMPLAALWVAWTAGAPDSQQPDIALPLEQVAVASTTDDETNSESAPDLQPAIELVNRGDALGAWHEFERVNDELPMAPAAALPLAEALVASIPQLADEADQVVTARVAERVAKHIMHICENMPDEEACPQARLIAEKCASRSSPPCHPR